MSIIKNNSTTLLSDNELLVLYQKNSEQEVLAQLFLRYYSLVYGSCIKYLNDQEAAKDAVMNIYHELVEKAKVHSISNFKSWLYTVTKNHCFLEIRKNKKVSTVDFNPEFMQSNDFLHLESVLEKEHQLEKLESCIQKLNNDQRKTICLFYLENKCYKEIMDVTGCEWNTVRSLVQNARRNLKICMERHG